MVAPVAICTRGARVPMFVALGISVVTLIAMTFIGARIGRADDFFFAALGAGLLLFVLAGIAAPKYAVALTGQRLLVFRRGRVSGRHIVNVSIAAPRGDLSTGFKSRQFGRLRWGILSLEFAPTTGQAPIQLFFGGEVDTPLAEAIHQGLATTAARGLG